MEENIENPSDYGIYIVDRRMKSIEESIQQLASQMISFCQKTRRQRINQRNRVERLSDILDWKRMGLEYVKARHLSMHRKYPELFDSDDEEISDNGEEIDMDRNSVSSITPVEAENTGVLSPLEKGRKIRKPFSAATSPKLREMANSNEKQMSELITSAVESLDHLAVSEKLSDLKTKLSRKSIDK